MSTFIVAEIEINHNGDMVLAKKLIDINVKLVIVGMRQARWLARV